MFECVLISNLMSSSKQPCVSTYMSRELISLFVQFLVSIACIDCYACGLRQRHRVTKNDSYVTLIPQFILIVWGPDTLPSRHFGTAPGGNCLVSYPDPNVRNADYRLQYNITYRGCYAIIIVTYIWVWIRDKQLPPPPPPPPPP